MRRASASVIGLSGVGSVAVVSSPAGSSPDTSKWQIATERESMKDPTYWELPEHVGQYRNDRKNLFLDGKSNLVIRAAKEAGKSIKVFVDETRPLLQGARLTAWELKEDGFDVTVVCDGAAAVGDPVQMRVVEGDELPILGGVDIGLEIAETEPDRLGKGGNRVLSLQIWGMQCPAPMREADRSRQVEIGVVGRAHRSLRSAPRWRCPSGPVRPR